MVMGLVVGPELQEVDPNVDEDLTIWVPYEDPRDPDLTVEWRFANNDLVIYPRGREVASFGQNVKLTAKQFEVLCFLAVNYGRGVSSEDVVSEMWGSHDVSDSIINLKVLIHELRLRTGNPRGMIQTHRGFGYQLKEAEPKQ